MEAWERLLERAVRGLQALADRGMTIPDLTLGGGTALMLKHRHRKSRDIDLFVPDPQYLPLLSPRLGGENIWSSDIYDEAAHYLKIRFEEGEVDFIVSARISDLPDHEHAFLGFRVLVEHPVEIALKKLYHRAEGLKPRDVFDVAVVIERHGDELPRQLAHLKDRRDKLMARLLDMPSGYYEQALDELDIYPEWEHLKPLARDMVAGLARAIPTLA